MPISQPFFTYKKIKSIFLKFDHSLLNAKNHGNRLNHSCRKNAIQKNTNAHINRFGPPYFLFFLCLKFIGIHYHTQKQWKNKIE